MTYMGKSCLKQNKTKIKHVIYDHTYILAQYWGTVVGESQWNSECLSVKQVQLLGYG